MISHAIVCAPGRNFAGGISSASMGNPDLLLALEQHGKYCRALVSDGIELISLPPQDHYPDSTFVEDTCVITGDTAVITRPGHTSRQGEEDLVARLLAGRLPLARISTPGLLDGGDVMVAEDRMFIGLSNRTNREGAGQLAEFARQAGFRVSLLKVEDGLHLKSGVNYIGKGTMVMTRKWRDTGYFREFELVMVPGNEEYAANSLALNSLVLVPEGFKETRAAIERKGLKTLPLEMSEFMKMDGGLSCLSIRW